MVELNIISGKHAERLSVPEKWSELDGRQLKLACMYRTLQAGSTKNMLETARRIIGAGRRMWRKIPPAQKCLMCEELLGFIINDTPSYRDNKIPTVRAGLRRLHGFDDMLSDVTWEEFIYADTFMLKGMFREAVAVLYRPANILTGKKKPFSDPEIPRNSKRIDKLDDLTITALAVNFRAVRKASVEEKNRHLFPSTDDTYIDGEKLKTDTDRPQAPSQAAGWADTHHLLMGELAYEERKFLDSKATTIICWINRRIRESKERERRKA
ncbi:MAG: hypothetical protein K5885_06705 [Bacteroidales bacterium]|nr:hypothetical protein [Bacteroidales bacterium]